MRATVSEPLEPSKAPSTESAREVTLAPRQALFIPALWAHAVRSDDASVAVNVFWPAASSGMNNHAQRDVYGNADAPAAEKALAAAAAAADALHRLPPDAASFYAARAVAAIQDAAAR